MRAIGGDNCHPGPYTALRRIRTLLIGKQADIIVKRSSVAMEDITAPVQIPLPERNLPTVDQEEVEILENTDDEELDTYVDTNNEMEEITQLSLLSKICLA